MKGMITMVASLALLQPSGASGLKSEQLHSSVSLIHEHNILLESKKFLSEGKIPLMFRVLDKEPDQNEIKLLAENTIDKRLQEQKLEQGLFFTFTKKNDAEHTYGGFQSKAGLFELGIVANPADQTVVLSEAELFGKPVLQVTGPGGAKWKQNNYYSFESGKPVLVLSLKARDVYPLAEGGQDYVVVTNFIGPALMTFLYKLENNQLQKADLNEGLNARMITYLPEKGIFQAFYDGNLVISYRLKGEELVEIGRRKEGE
ncbi:MAG: hypothetical protein ACM32O_08520 [Clostridia bacterium]